MDLATSPARRGRQGRGRCVCRSRPSADLPATTPRHSPRLASGWSHSDGGPAPAARSDRLLGVRRPQRLHRRARSSRTAWPNASLLQTTETLGFLVSTADVLVPRDGVGEARFSAWAHPEWLWATCARLAGRPALSAWLRPHAKVKSPTGLSTADATSQQLTPTAHEGWQWLSQQKPTATFARSRAGPNSAGWQVVSRTDIQMSPLGSIWLRRLVIRDSGT